MSHTRADAIPRATWRRILRVRSHAQRPGELASARNGSKRSGEGRCADAPQRRKNAEEAYAYLVSGMGARSVAGADAVPGADQFRRAHAVDVCAQLFRFRVRRKRSVRFAE